MLPSILAKQLEKGIGDYIETTFPMTNEPFKGSVRNMLDTKDAVYHEPYVSVRLPFRVADKMPDCFEAIHPEYLPYVHQQMAFARLTGDDGKSTLIATGTGSGKTECFLYPILEYCYQHRGERGIKALIIYPMNALASDQSRRIAELIYNSPELRGNVSVGMYVGGREQKPSRLMSEDGVITDHETLLNTPPDILMTNYKMLDYLLVRPKDAALWNDNNPDTLRYIAVDELHTFDGAQGTDLACLLRRLKSRLWTPAGYLCCVGTSATMGSKDNNKAILQYASEIFGEPFEDDAVITEDRLSPSEFFEDYDITDFTFPTNEQVSGLIELTQQDDEETYIIKAAEAWLDLEGIDITSADGKIALGEHLMHHSFLQEMISLMKGNYYQISKIIEGLNTHYPALGNLDNPIDAINALVALVSYARTGTSEHLRPFLNVQVQLWMRELRRLLAKVSPDNITYSIAHDLNTQQAKQYLPVVNCRDCGATGWTSMLNEKGNATITSLETFYNLFFKADDKIVMMFPYKENTYTRKFSEGKICPSCLQVRLGEDSPDQCDSCGTQTIKVMIPKIETSGSKNHRQYVCPFCGSKRGISLMGLRSATEISTSISQLFASKFNDDKKTLAFSDNVQDAAHRAGFFNARTWKFGLRSSIQHYVEDGGAGKTLAEFTREFIEYWHDNMDDEDFVSSFIGPNMIWMQAYEDMIKNRRLGNTKFDKDLMSDIEKRLSYEILLEYGLTSRIGRTLEKSGCSCLAFSKDELLEIAGNVRERIINEVGSLSNTDEKRYAQMVAGFVDIMRVNGAFDDEAFYTYLREKGNDYLLSNDNVRWMPGRQSGRNTPRFLFKLNSTAGRGTYKFDKVSDRKYTDWIESCCDEPPFAEPDYEQISQIILEELVRSGLVVAITASPEYTVYALDKNRVYITDKVAMMKCDTCGIAHAVAEEDKELWIGSPCSRSVCDGTFEEEEGAELDYYGKLFSSGDIVRINAKEHTGLLERDNREALEHDFKEGKKERRSWDPNVLSCTPTLEMGIDIGDLSTVVLCSMPPAQAQFLQRTGRAGRKDGNALTLAVAAARPHDLYFYADPLDMMQGEVQPPKIFLKASAVLERQFVAHCMDAWVKNGAKEDSIPRNIGVIIGRLDDHPMDIFPFNFLSYVQNNLTRLLNSFLQLFVQYLDDTSRNELREFAQGSGLEQSPMHMRILEAFESTKMQADALRASIKQLKDMVKELESKPTDSSYEDEIKELKAEEAALINVLKELKKKDVFNFLSDEGLLPNYAFPEAGIILKAVLYRKDETNTPTANRNRRYSKSVYEYSRSASAAISEFAPNNSFYVDGRKLTIDQVDLTSAQSAKWRLCPNCSYAQIEEAGKNTSSCPQCGSTMWADSGQVRNMLKVQMVYSNMDYKNSLISDESDDRSNVFYCKQLLVDVDEEHDIYSAYQMDNEDFAFGYEFVKKATLREINFGEKDMSGPELGVSGVVDVRKGFKICKYCGKIQVEGEKPKHTGYCKVKKMPLFTNEPFEECLFLYREFATETLRILIPATTMDSSRVRTESFAAAFMLGMKEYFGNVEHLRMTVSDVPVDGADYRKQYLVIYDSVPGGTGYLKQLMNEKGSLIDIFERALQKLEQCSCKEDPQKDGCYHCLYAYRQSQSIGSISRNAAIRMLRSILSGKDNLTKIKTIGSIPVNSLFDSELEEQFVEALSRMGNEHRKVEISKALIDGKGGYIFKINDKTWEIEPQVLLDATQGVKVKCKPDFIFRSVGKSDKLPVAIFTDGFAYHKDKVADDTLKREAIRRSGRYHVWSLSWYDVQAVFTSQGDYYTPTLAYEKMPSGATMYQPTITGAGADTIKPGKMSAMELLMQYLELDNADAIFQAHARGIALSLLEPVKITSQLDFINWNDIMSKANDQMNFTEEEFVQRETIFGTWIPRGDDANLSIYAGVLAETLKADKNAFVPVCAVLDDRKESRIDKYGLEWNGFWHFFNVMQFSSNFAAACRTGLDSLVYTALPTGTVQTVAEDNKPAGVPADGWDEIKSMLFDDASRAIADECRARGIAAPEEAGYELASESGEVIAEIELAWIGEKVGYMTEEQLADADRARAEGWRIFATVDEIDGIF